MASTYLEMKMRHSDELSAIPKLYALTDEEFQRQMDELGVASKDDLRHIGEGICVRFTDIPVLEEMSLRHRQEIQDAMDADKSGDGFIYQMFYAALEGHDYCFTMDAEDALVYLGITIAEIESTPKLKKAFHKAAKRLAW